jgi:DNA helicase-2/ATP-dependent DNA helicase PcrA
MPQQVTPAELSRLNVPGGEGHLYLNVYKEYQAALQTMHAVDFGDLILLTIHLFRTHPDILAQYNRQFRYVLVDEYQDINVAQYLWLRLLSQGSGNICCVGDDDQSIYGWRGAEVDHILRFEKDFPGAVLIRLEDNYRSTAPILEAASHLITQNTRRLGKTLRAASQETEGEPILIRGLWDDREEARFVGAEIESLIHQGHSPTDMAILVRAGFQTREFEERLIVLNIPYRIVGSLRFYDRLEIKDALAYLRIVAQPDDSLAFERILNTPKRGLGTSALQALHQMARSHGVSLFRAAEILVQTDHVKGAGRMALRMLVQDILRWRQALATQPLPLTVKMILDESGYTGFWKKEGSPEASARLENLKELVKVMQEFETLAIFLEHVSLVTDHATGPQDAALSIMTLHMAKGLEFETVFLAGWEEGLFPSPKTLEENGQKGLEEERRLAYVGLTRAKKRALITFAWNRRFYQGWQQTTPSRFIDDLPESCVTLELGQGASRPQWSGSQRSEPQWSGSQLSGSQLSGSQWASKKNATLGGPFSPQGPSPASQGPTFRPKAHSTVDLRPDIVFSDPENGLKHGDRVFHAQFGEGIVRSARGPHAEIMFQSGVKKIMTRFLTQQG